MKHLAAYLLLALGGNESPSAKDIEAVLESVGIDADKDRTKSLLKELKGKNLSEVYLITLTFGNESKTQINPTTVNCRRL